jgi:aldehyde dehydrogenase (NAD+)
MEKNAEELVYLNCLDNGKPLINSRLIDVNLYIDVRRYYAGWTDRVHGQTIPNNGRYKDYTRHEPVGVSAQIIPWNFPLLMASKKLGPAPSMGCTTIWKPAEQIALSALRPGESIMEVSFPNGSKHFTRNLNQLH